MVDLYQEYLYVIGKLKDIYDLHIDVDHKDIHTFYKDKKPLFKLFYGLYREKENPSIVVSFHLDISHSEAVQWYFNIFNIHPLLKMHESYVEDSRGETYLGEDAVTIREVYKAQEILAQWLENNTNEEIKEFVSLDVVGRELPSHKSFDSQNQREEATIEFERLKKPEDDESVH